MAKQNTEHFDNSFGACLKSYWTEYVGWGRATRSEYWWGILFYTILIPMILAYSGVSFIWTLATMVPSFTLTVRRWHDVNRSAWNMLWVFLPVIGWIVSIVYMCQPGTPRNRFGEPRIKLTDKQKGNAWSIIMGIIMGICSLFLLLTAVFTVVNSATTTEINIIEKETNITEKDKKITVFESAADCVSKGYIEVQRVIDDNIAIARTQSDVINGKIWYYGKDVVITNKKGQTYYDKQEIKAPNCFRQIGVYKDQHQTLPIVVSE